MLLSRLDAQTAPNPAPPIVLPQMDVSSEQQAQLNAIDRKTYLVGQDIQGVAGSAADVLQNIPSVQVDIDGNVSLRGDANVQVLIDGRPSSLMSATNRGDVLSQMPAGSIERIEVITNPSAMFKPDGSGGIINLVLKKSKTPGGTGTLRVTVGNGRRYGASGGASYNPGAYNLGGNLSLRQDDRVRTISDRRTYVDPVTGLPATTQSLTRENSRPWYELGEINLEMPAGSWGKLSEVVD